MIGATNKGNRINLKGYDNDKELGGEFNTLFNRFNTTDFDEKMCELRAAT